MSSTRTQSQLCTATPISSFVQCRISLIMGIVIYEGIDYLMGIVIVICVIYALSKLSSKLLNTMNEAVIYV